MIAVAFPAPAGMNRSLAWCVGVAEGVPRTRGDEPLNAEQSQALARRSPHPRG